MTRFAASVAFLHADLPYLERLGAARRDGFDTIETTWPPVDPATFAAGVRENGLGVALLNVREGDLAAGDRGHPNDPRRAAAWRRDLLAALDLAGAIGCPTVNVLAGNAVAGVPLEAQVGCLADNLAWAGPLARDLGVRLVVELLNAPEHPRYLARELDSTLALLEPLAGEGIGLQLDTYHIAQNGDDVVATFRAVAHLVGHVQIADVPGRGEPGTGTIDWPGFFGALDAAAYGGAVGLEYRPVGDTSAGLAWLPRDLRATGDAPYASVRR